MKAKGSRRNRDLTLVRMSVGGDDAVFPNERAAISFLVNKLANHRYGFGTNKPHYVRKGGYAVFSFNRRVIGEAKVFDVVRDSNGKVKNVVFGAFQMYKERVLVAVKKGQDGLMLPELPGQQFGYYNLRVLHELRKLGEGGLLLGKKVLSAAEAAKIGKRSEKCAIAYETECRRATVTYVGPKNIGYDLQSTLDSRENRFIEVKTEGAHVELTPNELYAAQKLRDAYYLYVVGRSSIRIIRDPASAAFKPKIYTSVRYEPIDWQTRGEGKNFTCRLPTS